MMLFVVYLVIVCLSVVSSVGQLSSVVVLVVLKMGIGEEVVIVYVVGVGECEWWMYVVFVIGLLDIVIQGSVD